MLLLATLPLPTPTRRLQLDAAALGGAVAFPGDGAHREDAAEGGQWCGGQGELGSIDDVHGESAQARLARLDNVFRTTVRRGRVSRGTDVAELGGEHYPLALPFDGLAHEFLVLAAPVDVRGVDEIDPPIERPMQVRDYCARAGLSLDRRTQPDGGYFERAQPAARARDVESSHGTQALR